MAGETDGGDNGGDNADSGQVEEQTVLRGHGFAHELLGDLLAEQCDQWGEIGAKVVGETVPATGDSAVGALARCGRIGRER